MIRSMPIDAPRDVTAVLPGTSAVPGVAAAPAVRPIPRARVDGKCNPLPEADRAAALAGFRQAAAVVAERLRDRASHVTGVAAEVLATNAAMATDRAWIGSVEKQITEGSAPPVAVVAATEQFAQMFTKLGGLMAERVTDLRDVCDRVVAELLGAPEPGMPVLSRPSILLASDLAPADTAALDPNLVVGLATSLGGPTSHTAIIARQLGIPCVVAVARLDDVPAGADILLDGSNGLVVVNPDPQAAAEAVARHRDIEDQAALWTGPGATSDGRRIEILANVQDAVSARNARCGPAEGIGLFRTELCFLEHEYEPTIDDQAALYRAVLDAYSGRKVIIRTLDAGSDKPLRFAHHTAEPNPALGVRGYRLYAHDTGILDRQLDAIAVAARDREPGPWVMAPMIATVAEARSFADKARARGLTPGVMIEIPAAALLIESLLEHVDFASIGTNDLAQYTMAADRMSPQLAALTDPWQPAVLALVARAATAGMRLGKPIGVCGEAAADPLLACVLAGLGVTSLSAAATSVGAVGAMLATVTSEGCRRAADAALGATDPQAARTAARSALGV